MFVSLYRVVVLTYCIDDEDDFGGTTHKEQRTEQNETDNWLTDPRLQLKRSSKQIWQTLIV